MTRAALIAIYLLYIVCGRMCSYDDIGRHRGSELLANLHRPLYIYVGSNGRIPPVLRTRKFSAVGAQGAFDSLPSETFPH